MSIFTSLLAKWGYVKATQPQQQYPNWATASAGVEKWEIPQDGSVYGVQADLYRKLSWIAMAIDIFSQTCAAQKFEVYNVQGEDEKEIDNHPFESLLYNPNPLMSRAEFLVATYAYRALTGNAYWWLNRTSADQEPAEMWLLPSNHIVPKPDERLFLKGYEYDPGNGQKILLEPWEVVHFKRFNPRSMFVGLSPIEAIAVQSNADINQVAWANKIYSQQNGRLPGILAFADKFQESDWLRIQNEVKQAAAKRELMMLQGTGAGSVNWISATMSNQDMQFLETRTFTKEEIFGIFAPGLASMLAVNATEANSKAGKATFSEFSVWPALDSVAQRITKDILPAYGENLHGEFEDPRVKDKVIELQEIAEYSKTHTLAEIRAKYYNDEPLGDERDDLLPVQINAQSGGIQEPPVPPALPGKPAQDGTGQKEPQQPDQNKPDNAPQGNVDETTGDELAKMRRKAIKRLKEKGSAVIEFQSDILQGSFVSAIVGQLEAAKSEQDITQIFAAAAEWQAYP